MSGSAAETRRKLLEAAAVEFAEFGVAGGRTGRIASVAGVNEALIFRYFGSKRELFDRVFDELVVQTVNEVPMTAYDLPGYAGRLFDYYAVHPQVVRLAVWDKLQGESKPAATVVHAFDSKVRQVRGAQAEGGVSSELAARELLSLVIHMSLSGTEVSVGGEPTSLDLDVRRASVVHAVDLLTRPRG